MTAYSCEPLAGRHSVQGFTCGQPELDEWLRNSASTVQAKGLARVRVWSDDADQVAAYFCLSPHRIRREELPAKLGRGNPAEIPAILLGKFAVHSSGQGKGYGGQLLRDVFEISVAASDRVGGRFLVVDSLNEDAESFYRKYGFTDLPGPHPTRLAIKLSDVRASLESPI